MVLVLKRIFSFGIIETSVVSKRNIYFDNYTFEKIRKNTLIKFSPVNSDGMPPISPDQELLRTDMSGTLTQGSNTHLLDTIDLQK